MNSKNTIHVVAALIKNHHNQYLITRRLPDAEHGGLWEFPGGKVKNGESHQAALKRELLEETALEIETGDLFREERIIYPDKQIHLYFYHCAPRRKNQSIHMHEIDDFRWVDRMALSEYQFPAGDRNIVLQLQKDK